MTTTEGSAYAKRSRRYLAQSAEELARGDLLQASEKGWGAASSIVKALAVERGWAHEDVRALYSAVSRVYLEMNDPSFVDMFATAGELRFNALEPVYIDEDVRRSLARVTRFTDKIKALLPA